MKATFLAIAGVLLACSGAGTSGGEDGGGDDGGDDGGGDDGGGDGGGPAAPYGVRDILAPAHPQVVFEIDYEAGEAPYTGALFGGGDTFDLSATNLDRLFAGKKTLTLPRTLGEMEDIGAIADEELTTQDLLAIAQQHRQQVDAPGTRTFYVLFVSGHFTDANGPNPNVLGVSLGATGVIVMFKDVIASAGGGISLTDTKRFVEQTTLVHEIGHAIGLVDNGIAMAAPHGDANHAPHCSSDSCVMYWLNEGAAAANQYVLQNVLSRNTILFDAQCLADVDAITGGP